MKINKLSINEIVEQIQKGVEFEAIPTEGGFKIKISKYVPYCCTAIHNGSNLRHELKAKIALNDYERWYEEDPNTADFIASMPINIVGLDSRFEYDLNRSPEACIYDEAWGKNVWRKKLTSQELKASKKKHQNYYIVLRALINKLESLFDGCVIYDIHSYNHKRWERDVPLFNIGTSQLKNPSHRPFIDQWISQLSDIEIADVENITKENDVFQGNGYNLEYVNNHFKKTLVLATEIKKVYCDELSGDIYPKILSSLQKRLKTAILNNANYFGSSLTKWHHKSTPSLLGKNYDDTVFYVDKSLNSLLRNFELLTIVNPTNTKVEKKKFFRSKGTIPPKFRYTPVKLNPFTFKQTLLSIPVQNIQDISLRSLYQASVNSYLDKVDLIATLNTNKFLFNSLRYFGRPSNKDLINANYILHLPDIPGEAKKEPIFKVNEAIEIFKNALDKYKLDVKIELSNRVISHVMVLNSKKKILFQPDATFKRKELTALIEHEIGVHMVTTMNSLEQKLMLFKLGFPVNTETQEGLAILAEYLSGSLTLKRLKKLALRVKVVNMMSMGADFIECFRMLVQEHDVEEDDAFFIVTRVFRGGGFTKDYLYLSGFVKIFKLWTEHYDLTPLLIGKTSLNYINTIEEMIGREMLSPPKYITQSYLNPKTENNSPIYNYIFSGLKY